MKSLIDKNTLKKTVVFGKGVEVLTANIITGI